MQLLAYLLLYPLIWCIARLPFPMLYLLSDATYVLVYRLIGYRKKTVRKNLELAFPQKSTAEIIAIEKKSYRHLCDMFMEMIKTMAISRKEIDARFSYTNLEVYTELEKKGKSIAVLIPHYASYEWVISMNHIIQFKGYAIYKRINNTYFDKMVRDIRSRFKAYLITTKETKKIIESNAKEGILGVYGFASDQTPRWGENLYWHHFMGIETPIHIGAESLAKRYDMNMIYLRVEKVKRGYYVGTFEVLTDNVKSVPDYKISEYFMSKVEEQINAQPEYYMWTHKRWKHKKESL